MKNPFKVNQIWYDELNKDKSIFIYQVYNPEVNEFHDENEESFVLSVLINEKLFNEKVEKYQSLHNVADKGSTYPFCIYKENKINSLKQYVKKYNLVLLCEESFDTTEYDNGEFQVLVDEYESIKKVWEKYS